jgi:hypothetical protein
MVAVLNNNFIFPSKKCNRTDWEAAGGDRGIWQPDEWVCQIKDNLVMFIGFSFNLTDRIISNDACIDWQAFILRWYIFLNGFADNLTSFGIDAIPIYWSYGFHVSDIQNENVTSIALEFPRCGTAHFNSCVCQVCNYFPMQFTCLLLLPLSLFVFKSILMTQKHLAIEVIGATWISVSHLILCHAGSQRIIKHLILGTVQSN